MNIFTAPQWDIDEASAKSANVFAGSEPVNDSSKSPRKRRRGGHKKTIGVPSSDILNIPHNQLASQSTINNTVGQSFQKLMGLASNVNNSDNDIDDKLAKKKQKRKLRLQKLRLKKKQQQSNAEDGKGQESNQLNENGDNMLERSSIVDNASENQMTKNQKQRLRKKLKRQQLNSDKGEATHSPARENSSTDHASLSQSTAIDESKEAKLEAVNQGTIAKSLYKLERLLELRKRKRNARKAKKDSEDIPTVLPEKDAASSSSPVNSDIADLKKMKMKLKKKEKLKKKKEALAKKKELEKEMSNQGDTEKGISIINEVVLTQRKKRKMRRRARKISEEKLNNSVVKPEAEHGTQNPSFDESLTGSTALDDSKSNDSVKAKKKRRRGKKKSLILSDTVDGNLVSVSSSFALESNKGSSEKQIVPVVSTSGVVEDKSQQKKMVVAKLLQEAEISENTTLHDLKKKRRLELEENLESSKKQMQVPLSLREKVAEQLKSARFRWINQQLYSYNSWEALKYFKEDPEAYDAYHSGYRNQVAQWPVNPIDTIIKSISSLPKDIVVADFGCGEARLAETLDHLKVHSFDLVAKKPNVVACDMAHTPLLMESVDIAVFCLSLMGKNLNDFVLEANRVLKIGGILMIAEVESRFEDIDNFTSAMVRFGFQLKNKDLSNQMFIFMDFKKLHNVSKTGKLPSLTLDPCVYKKR